MLKRSLKNVMLFFAVTAILLNLSGCGQKTKENNDSKLVPPEESTFFSTVFIEDTSSAIVKSDGDLWPTAWSDDDYLYTANGDGKGFAITKPWGDIVFGRFTGSPDKNDLKGERLTSGNQLGQVWSNPEDYNRKPTGLISVNGDLYMAVQDLRKTGPGTFNEVPAASIVKSTDKGATWTWDKSAPMFKDYVFTTVFFLDFGKDNENAIDDYVYAYGIDNNWRDSFNNAVADPTELFLARVPKTDIQDRSKWEFYTGDLKGKAAWSSKIEDKKPVLKDERRVYPKVLKAVEEINDMTVISQGSVIYNKQLDRYIYTSWTEYTFEFYEAPSPWGPWKKFVTKDFGAYPWSKAKHGGYATVIPTKFISADGTDMWIVSATFMGGYKNYQYAMRKMTVSKYQETKANNKKGPDNLALEAGTTPIFKSLHFGKNTIMNDGSPEGSEDSWNGEDKTSDWWGYTWPQAYNFNKIEYTTGKMLKDGGWFNDIKVQVRQKFEWKDVKIKTVAPEYQKNNTTGANTTYTFTFSDTWGDGIRIIGTPGGDSKFTSISEMAVYFDK